MEITVIIDGKKRVFKQNTVNFRTMYKALEWESNMQKEQEALVKLLSGTIEDDVEIESLQEQIKPFDDLNFTADLIVSFFNGQFTYDEFINGVYFKDISEFYALGSQIFELVYAQKKDTESKQKKSMS